MLLSCKMLLRYFLRFDSKVYHILMIKSRKFPILLFALLSVLLNIQPLSAERPSFKIYTTEEGLAHDSVNTIVRDSHGFLWFCTAEGLSR